jgi:hypothetical protein
MIGSSLHSTVTRVRRRRNIDDDNIDDDNIERPTPVACP